MADKDTSREYWKTVKTLANLAESEKEEYDTDIHKTVRESVEGSYWVVYTHAQLKVLQHTDNLDAISMFGEIEGNDAGDVIMQIAYFAMVQDVMDNLG